MQEDTRSCSVCAQPLPGRLRRGSRLCSVECQKEAARIRAREWYEARKNDPEWKPRIAANRSRAHRRWREGNLDRVKAALAQWREANRDAAAEQYRRWRIENADKVREKNQRRRARLLGAFVAPVDPVAIWERDGGICQLCREPIDPGLEWPDRMSRTIDHIVPLANGGTHEPANVQLAHAVCNSIKGDRITS